MLRRLSNAVADSYRRASEARRRADQANDSDTREFWLRSEVRWLWPAASQEVSERVNSFVGGEKVRASGTERAWLKRLYRQRSPGKSCAIFAFIRRVL
jgi:hypothetical protein